MTEPDPKTVREIARKHIRSGHADIGITIIDHFGNGALGDEEYVDWHRAVVQAWRVELRAVEWPDEQQPADVVTAEQQQDGAVGRVEAFRAHWREIARNDMFHDDRIAGGPTPEDPVLTDGDLDALLAERTALAARVAELESEREADTRAVVRIKAADTIDFSEGAFEEWSAANGALYDRFADRIEALDATEIEES